MKRSLFMASAGLAIVLAVSTSSALAATTKASVSKKTTTNSLAKILGDSNLGTSIPATVTDKKGYNSISFGRVTQFDAETFVSQLVSSGVLSSLTIDSYTKTKPSTVTVEKEIETLIKSAPASAFKVSTYGGTSGKYVTFSISIQTGALVGSTSSTSGLSLQIVDSQTVSTKPSPSSCGVSGFYMSGTGSSAVDVTFTNRKL